MNRIHKADRGNQNGEVDADRSLANQQTSSDPSLFGLFEEQAAPTTVSACGLRTLLVPLDGSSFSEHAIPRALAIARRSGATIRLVHVHSLLDSIDEPWRLHHAGDLCERLLRQKQAYLNDVVRRIGRVGSVRLVAILAEDRWIAPQLCRAAQGVDLVVMATHGRGLWGRFVHGSMADTLIRRVSCPLLLVRGYESPPDFTGDPIARKVLIPLDGSKFAEQILGPATAIGQLSAAEVTLLHVQKTRQTNLRFAHAEAMGYLRHAAGLMNIRSPVVTTQVVHSQEGTATAVRSFAAKHNINLVALTTHGHSGLTRLIRGSVTDAVIQAGETSILVLRPIDQSKDRVQT